MAASLNKVFLIGNLTADPSLKYTPGGSAVCGFDLAINRQYKDKAGALQKETTYIKIAVWGKTGENCANYLQKGKLVFIEGRLQLDQWTTEDGQKRSMVKVVADSVQFLSPKGEGGPRQQADAVPEGERSDYRPDDDVPF